METPIYEVEYHHFIGYVIQICADRIFTTRKPTTPGYSPFWTGQIYELFFGFA